MTTIYFVRHAQPDYAQENLTRPLTAEGMQDRYKALEVLKNKNITAVYSSPIKRAYDTVKPIADEYGLEIKTDARLMERANGKGDESFEEYATRQWSDFSYKRTGGGESLGETLERNIEALKEILSENDGKTIVIGTHGASLSVIINYYKSEHGFEEFMRMLNFMPNVVKLEFDGQKFVSYEEIFHIEKEFKKPEKNN